MSTHLGGSFNCVFTHCGTNFLVFLISFMVFSTRRLELVASLAHFLGTKVWHCRSLTFVLVGLSKFEKKTFEFWSFLAQWVHHCDCLTKSIQFKILGGFDIFVCSFSFSIIFVYLFLPWRSMNGSLGESMGCFAF